MSSNVSIRELALTGGRCGPIAREYATALIQQVPFLQIHDVSVDTILDQNLSLSAHVLLKHKHTIPEGPEFEESRKLASKAAYMAISLRGAFAMQHGEHLVSPYDMDLLASDMNDITISGIITKELFNNALGPRDFGAEIALETESMFPVPGFLFGFHNRPFFTFNVKFKEKAIKLPFFVDTGGQEACINSVSWRALAPNLDLSNWTPSTYKLVSVHGINTMLHLGMERTEGVNMVGSKWLTTAGLMLLCDFSLKGRGCLVVKSSPDLQALFPQLPLIGL